MTNRIYRMCPICGSKKRSDKLKRHLGVHEKAAAAAAQPRPAQATLDGFIQPVPPATCKTGIIYGIENECFPGMIKIGKTTSTAEKRLKGAQTFCPKPFTVRWTVCTTDIDRLESTVHKALDRYSVKEGGGTEFFRVGAAESLSCIASILQNHPELLRSQTATQNSRPT